MGFQILQSTAPVQERRNRLDSIHERLRGERERMRVRHRTSQDNRAQQLRDRRRRELEFVEAMEQEIRLEVNANESRNMDQLIQNERREEGSNIYTLHATPRSPWRHLQQLAALSGEIRPPLEPEQSNSDISSTPDVINSPPIHRRIIPAYVQPTFPNNIISRTASAARSAIDIEDSTASNQTSEDNIFTRTFAIQGDDWSHNLEVRPTQLNNYTSISNNRRFNEHRFSGFEAAASSRRRDTDFTSALQEFMQSAHDPNNRSFVSALSRNLFHSEQEDSQSSDCRKNESIKCEFDEETPYSLRYNVYNVREEPTILTQRHNFRLIQELD